MNPLRQSDPAKTAAVREASILARPLGVIFIVLVLVLLPWTVYLAFELPERQTAAHWDLAWVGFDVAIAAGLLATGIWILRRSPKVTIAACATGTLLLCDAWFDVVTSSGVDVWISIAEAVVAELPLAFTCFWIARSVERVLEDLQPILIEAGVSIENRRIIVPPAARRRAGLGP